MKRHRGAEWRGIQFRKEFNSEEGRSQSAEAVAAEAPSLAKTLVYVHGIGNKPIASILKRQWDKALFGVDLGQRSRMAYWVNRDYYPIPSPADVPEGRLQPLPEPDTLAVQLHAMEAPNDVDDIAVYQEAMSLARTNTQKDVLLSIARTLQQAQRAGDHAAEREAGPAGISAEILPTDLLRRVVTRNLTRALLRDVNDFLYHPLRRKRMEDSLRERLQVGGPFVIIGHSQGSMIAYSVLSQMARENADVDVRLFVSTGSPLGIQEVQDELLKITRQERLAIPGCVARWVNVADRLDPVAADVTLNDDFAANTRTSIEDIYRLKLNPDSPRHPHSGTGYLQTKEVRKAVKEAVGPRFDAPVTNFSMSRDVAASMEDHLPHERLSVLIELKQVEGKDLAEQRAHVATVLRSLSEFNDETAQLELLDRYVAVRLTRSQIERLASRLTTLKLGRIWRNTEKTSLILESCNSIHVRPAWQSFQADGRKICWAVLDTGVNAGHPHFNSGPRPTIVEQYDCTNWSLNGRVDRAIGSDPNGHGTHVAGIIAGRMEVFSSNGDIVTLSGMAPEASLISYKVLDDDGRGRDSWIIKALQDIAAKNEKSAELVIHGINLSLGGNFDPTVYACGHSPLCNELRRLWRQGVLVCIAAGNRGLTEIQTSNGPMQSNLDITIGDPANLEEAIAIGSVHKLNPFTYGISYFSSRGPTADGRLKPDVIAPGERIVSANTHFTNPGAKKIDDLYIELSGTSMAAPHVSGLLASFLSLRREFVGYPDKVKTILLDSCSPLEKRDVYSQGRGLPSLMNMLSST